MSAALVVVGVVVVVLVAADLSLTILHPSLRGPLSGHAERIAWIAVRGLSRHGRRAWLLSFGGPAAMGADLVAWVLGLWLGFALIYTPFADTFQYSPAGFLDGGNAGVLEALYLSGASLTTVGFGDVVAGDDALRLVTILESASGLALITAAIAYITAVYSRVSLVRAAASRASDLEADTEVGAVRLVCHGGQGEVARLQRDLIEIHQDLLRFPVLYYFHARVPGESVATLFRAAALVCACLRWGLREESFPFASLYGPGLERTLGRVMHDYAWEFRAGRRLDRLDGRGAQARLHRLHDAVRAVAPEAVSGEPGLPPDLAPFLARIDTFLHELGRVHGYRSAPLLGQA